MIDQKDVTIIIPHLGAEQSQCYALRQGFTSLRETFEGDIIIAKNGSKSCYCPRDLRVIKQGQCRAVNAAVAATNTPWVFITNDDMIYAPGWFERLTHSIPMSDGCISAQLVEPRPGAPTFRTHFCGGAGGDFDKQKFLDFVEEVSINENISDRPGFNFPLLIRRSLWDLVGGYDINYDPWGSNSDSDLEYKIKLAGVQPIQNTGALVYHFSQTSGTFEPRNSDAWGKNWQYFIDKWGFPRTDDGIWEASFEIPSIAAGRKFAPVWEGKYNV
jgi:GT2 family glycosyltransferase